MESILELAKQALARIDAEKHCKGTVLLAPESPNLERDRTYAALFEAAMDRMRAEPMPADCLSRLAEHENGLYRMLTKALPDKLEEIRSDPGDHRGAFEFILDRIVDAHRKARELYAQRSKNAVQGLLKGHGEAVSRE